LTSVALAKIVLPLMMLSSMTTTMTARGMGRASPVEECHYYYYSLHYATTTTSSSQWVVVEMPLLPCACPSLPWQRRRRQVEVGAMLAMARREEWMLLLA